MVAETGLEIEVRAHGPRVELLLAGEVDLATVGRLRDHLEGIDGTAREILVDLRDVTFMDSSGLAELIRANRRLGSELKTLLVTHPRPNVRSVLELTGLGDLCAPEAEAAPLDPPTVAS